jgi:hypothetical protein
MRRSSWRSPNRSRRHCRKSPDYVDAAQILLATLSERVALLPSESIALTKQQVETFLDFDPEFLDVAKDMLRAFIEKTKILR